MFNAFYELSRLWLRLGTLMLDMAGNVTQGKFEMTMGILIVTVVTAFA